MRIKSIEIKKFRSIDYCKLYMDEITAVVGQNNSGKSAIIRGLNAFFNYETEELSFLQLQHQYSPNSQPKIEICFEGVSGISDFSAYASGDDLVVQMTYIPSSKRRVLKFKKNGNYHSADESLISEVKKKLHSCTFLRIEPLNK